MDKRMLTLLAAGAAIAITAVLARPAQATTRVAAAPVDFKITGSSPGRLVYMQPVNDTKTRGVAVFIYDPIVKQTVVTVAAINFPTGGHFFPNVTTNKCGADGDVVASLPTIAANSNKAGASAGLIKGTWVGKNWHISLYRKAGLLGFQRWSISCSNV
jgi:hypothetical protein